MSRQLFGTDGVRGRAGEFLTADLALSLARAAVELSGDQHPRVLIVRDTRESGEMLEAAIAAGVTSAGGDVLLGGVLPTPAAPLLLRRHGLQLAVVISASHNPYEDNGIKFFASDGFKLSDESESEIENRVDVPGAPAEHIGRVRDLHGALEDYLRELHTRFESLDLTGRRILLDCANGATYRAAPEIFRRLGAEVDVIANDPDGRNINAGVGSTHIDLLCGLMAAGDHDAGFAFDGDGDRVLAVDRHGVVIDGDELIAIVATHYKRTGVLNGGGVAVTVMTNYGFHTAMQQAGIEVTTTAVGDRYVGFAPSGDGTASALLTLEALGDGDLGDRQAMVKLPQKLVNIRAASRERLTAAMESSGVKQAVSDADASLCGRGRVLVRASGTEPLIRVMVEAPTQEETDEICSSLATTVESALA